VQYPYAIKVDKEMPSRPFLKVGFEKDSVPLYLAETSETLCGGQVDEALAAAEDDFAETFWVPEELIDVVVAYDVCMVLFLADELAVDDFVSLVSHEPVERLDDGFHIEPLLYRLYPVLAFWTPIIVICALEDIAQTLWDESNISGLAPEHEKEGNLPETVVLAHVVHRVSPPIESRVEGL
jgi:hypothetical protein